MHAGSSLSENWKGIETKAEVACSVSSAAALSTMSNMSDFHLGKRYATETELIETRYRSAQTVEDNNIV